MPVFFFFVYSEVNEATHILCRQAKSLAKPDVFYNSVICNIRYSEIENFFNVSFFLFKMEVSK
jgi:hypothetical protein